MQYLEALKIIADAQLKNREGKPIRGYIVHFDEVRGSLLYSDYFPDKREGEALIKTEEEAWLLARAFASKTVGKCVDVYVCDNYHIPVFGYEKKKIKNRKE